MNAHELASVVGLLIVAAVVAYLAYVILAALRNSTGTFLAKLKWLKIADFVLKIGRPKGRAVNRARKKIPDPSCSLLYRRALLVVAVALIIVATPILWWFRKPALWRVHIVKEFNRFTAMLAQDTEKPVIVVRGKETLDQITNTVDSLTEKMKKNPYQRHKFRVLDHHWEYWNTDALDPYWNANKEFVASGGSIQRMFLLTNEEMKRTEVQHVIQRQCDLGRASPGQTGTGFELWRADPNLISKREEYEGLSRAFHQLPDTAENFNNFDIVQFDGVLYYSSDFSPDYRVMGRSLWLFNEEAARKVDLTALFKDSIAERIPCERSVLAGASPSK